MHNTYVWYNGFNKKKKKRKASGSDLTAPFQLKIVISTNYL